MKRIIQACWAAAVAASLTVSAQDPAQVDFEEFAGQVGEGQFVDIHIQGNLLSLASRLVQKENPEAARLLQGLKMVRVNVVGMTDENREGLKERTEELRAKLAQDGWERVVTVRETNQDVGIYVKTRGDETIEGVVVSVIEANKDAVLINVVGSIKPEELVEVGESLDITPLKELGKMARK